MRKTLDEATVKRILDRAVQLDAERSGYMDSSQIRGIASELGISREAVDVALAEHESAVEQRHADRRGVRRTLIIIGITVTVLIGTFVFGRVAPRQVRVPAPPTTPAPPVPAPAPLPPPLR